MLHFRNSTFFRKCSYICHIFCSKTPILATFSKNVGVMVALFCVTITCSRGLVRYFALFCVILGSSNFTTQNAQKPSKEACLVPNRCRQRPNPCQDLHRSLRMGCIGESIYVSSTSPNMICPLGACTGICEIPFLAGRFRLWLRDDQNEGTLGPGKGQGGDYRTAT